MKRSHGNFDEPSCLEIQKKDLRDPFCPREQKRSRDIGEKRGISPPPISRARNLEERRNGRIFRIPPAHPDAAGREEPRYRFLSVKWNVKNAG